MPELPEVEAARRSVEEHLVGKRILTAHAEEDDKVIEKVTPAELEKALKGRLIVEAKRKGKILWLQLDEAPHPAFHFGMTGSMQIRGVKVTQYKRAIVSDDEEWPPKYYKLRLQMEGGLEVAFTDPRRFARIRLHDNPESEKPISELGPDALLDLPASDAFTSSLEKRKQSLKALLLDQSFLAGIGNWVADEILYKARLHPEQPASSLSHSDCSKLHDAIQQVLDTAVEANADSEKFPKDWIFHVRWGKKAGSVNGETIAFITVGGRTSAYVPGLQKLVGLTKKSSTTGSGIRKGKAAEKQEEDGVIKQAAKKVKGGDKTRKLRADAETTSPSAAETRATPGRRKTTRKPTVKVQEPRVNVETVSKTEVKVVKGKGKARSEARASTSTGKTVGEAQVVGERARVSGAPAEGKETKPKRVRLKVGRAVAKATLDPVTEPGSNANREDDAKAPSKRRGRSSTAKDLDTSAMKGEGKEANSSKVQGKRERSSVVSNDVAEKEPSKKRLRRKGR